MNPFQSIVTELLTPYGLVTDRWDHSYLYAAYFRDDYAVNLTVPISGSDTWWGKATVSGGKLATSADWPKGVVYAEDVDFTIEVRSPQWLRWFLENLIATHDLHRSVLVRVDDDWNPCITGPEGPSIRLTIESRPDGWLVHAWGGDDFGFERHFDNQAAATQTYDSVIQSPTLNAARFATLGFTPA